MPKASIRRSPRPRRSPRATRRRAAQSKPQQQQFLLHCSIAAVLALVLAFGDAESMRAHHRDAGQGHARPNRRRDTATERERFGFAPAAAAAASCEDGSRSRRRVEGSPQGISYGDGTSSGSGRGIFPFTRAGHDEAPGRGPSARPTATTAFVASSAWSEGPICSTRQDGRPAATGASTSMSMSRRRRRHAQPTQQQRQQQQYPWPQDHFAGATGSQHGGGGRSSWRSYFHDTRTAFLPGSRERQHHAGRHNPPSYFHGPAPFHVAGGSSSGSGGGGSSNDLVPFMCAGAGETGGGSGLTRPPLLITIGPQCAGKTSLLQGLAAKCRAAREREATDSSSRGGGGGKSGIPSVTDVTIDDHPSVYHKIRTGVLLDGCERGSPEDTRVGRRPLSDRLREPGCVETRLVALRLVGSISAEEFADRLKGYGGKASPAALATLCSAVEAAVAQKVGISTPTVDVFVRENLFPDAISSSQERLALAARTEDGLVAWGNTNTQARDFQGALEQAELTSRPVRFLRWGYELPVLSLEELSKRNVRRFASTGRYVEMAAVESALSRVDKLYASTLGGDPASLALAAGFQMDSAGKVYSRSGKRDRSRSSGGTGGGRDGGDCGGGNGGWTGGAGGGGAAGWPEGGGTVAFDGGGSIMTAGAPSRTSFAGAENPAARAASSSSSSSNSNSRNTGFYGGKSGRTRSPPPPVGRPLPVGPGGRLAFDGPDHRWYDNTAAAAHAPQGLAQEWAPRGGSGGARAPTGEGSSRRWDHYSGTGAATGAASVAPTVMFGNEWGRKREWRRTGYTDDDIDPTLSSCFFRKPANSTGELRRSDLGEGSGPDLEEMELVRRIKSFRERR
eukprot:g6968.t1